MTARFGRQRGMRTPPDRNLTYTIVERLGQAIVTGGYNGKTGFPVEAALCEDFSASRSVLREAVKMLTAKGLLAARPRQGTWVEPEEHWNLLDPDVLRWLLERKFSLELLSEFTEMRLAVEPMAAELAARNPKRESVAPIRQALLRMKAAAQGDDDPLESDIAFHVAVLRASGNRFYAQLEDLIDTALRISIRLTNQFKGAPIGNIADHKKVLDAIEARDIKKARASMDLLLRGVVELIATAEKKVRRRA
jgi:DNA-binding FadR family transcriptional regulator